MNIDDTKLCFQSVAIDMPVNEEDSLETIEQLRNRYETICYSSWYALHRWLIMAGNFLFSSVFSVFRLQEMEELYEAKCREGEVGNIIFSLSSDNFVLLVLLRVLDRAMEL